MDGDTPSARSMGSKGEEDISGGVEQITLARTGGEVTTLDPYATRIFLADEHAPLSQMNEDWGAVCEAFRQQVDTYARIPGVALQAGDEIRLHYHGQAGELVLRVLEMENGRARVTLTTR